MRYQRRDREVKVAHETVEGFAHCDYQTKTGLTTEIIRLIWDREPKMATWTSSFTQLLSSD